MEWWQALILALVQGLTEFLPISSSAHLLFPSLLLGWPDQGLAFDVAVHLGTLLAVLLFYRKDLWYLAAGGAQAIVRREQNQSSREIIFLALATLPAIAVGFLLNDHMDALRSIPVIATTTVLFGLLLGYADRRVSSFPKLSVETWKVALVIGLAQAIAPIPGTSRSGITMTAGLLLGLSRQTAARFSFLLSIPVILGAGLLKTLDLLDADVPVDWGMLALGASIAAFSAYACIAVFLRVIERLGMLPFVVYRLLLGFLLFALLLLPAGLFGG
ncbi:MAG: undecaprenyl-diphosphate phosphatase [Congregibacter sp.]